MRARLSGSPTVFALAGAVAIAFSAILYRFADVSPSTGAFFRCAYAVPPLLLLAWLEDRRVGPRPWRTRLWAWLAGAFFAVDLIVWHRAIEYVGAGLATVLGNTQVLLVGVAAWLLFRERPSRAAMVAIPVAVSRSASSTSFPRRRRTSGCFCSRSRRRSSGGS